MFPPVLPSELIVAIVASHPDKWFTADYLRRRVSGFRPGTHDNRDGLRSRLLQLRRYGYLERGKNPAYPKTSRPQDTPIYVYRWTGREWEGKYQKYFKGSGGLSLQVRMGEKMNAEWREFLAFVGPRPKGSPAWRKRVKMRREMDERLGRYMEGKKLLYGA